MSALERTQTTAGEFPNFLGLLSTTDSSKLNSKRFFEVTKMEKSELAMEAKISRPTVYKDEIDLKSLKKLKEGILQLVWASDLVFELFMFDDVHTRGKAFDDLLAEEKKRLKEKAEAWIMAPSQILFGQTPFEVCLRGEGSDLISWLKAKLGKEGAEPY